MPKGIYKGNKGKKLSLETKELIRKNSPKYWLNKKLSTETKTKISLAKKGKVSTKKGKHYISHSDNNHWGWKGDMVGYGALHSWIRRKMGKANKCSNDPSHDATRYHWANNSGEYKRNLEDWRELCPKCNRLEKHNAKKIFISKVKYLSTRRGGEDLRH